MKKTFFVIIHGKDHGIPMTEEGGELSMFSTAQEALECAHGNDAATVLGFDVFEIGNGVEGGDPL